MNARKTMVRFFTIADYEEEEIWLREQHRNGWKLVRMNAPCFFVFERCVPEDVVYRLDYWNNSEGGDYYQILQDYGWDYVGKCLGWLYFRKPMAEIDSEQDGELFSDVESRIDMIDHVVRTRFLPIFIVFCACVIPNFFRALTTRDPMGTGLTIFFGAMVILYLWLVVYCGIKLRKLRRRCERE